MRLTSVRLAFLFCAALFLLGPAAALTQQPGGNGKGKGGRGGDTTQPGGGGRNIDPTQLAQQMFDRLANGKDVIVIADLPTQGSFNAQATLQAWAATKGITNGQLTRDQYTEYVKERLLAQAPPGGGPGGTTTSGPEVKEEKFSVEVYRLKNVEPNDALEALNVLVGYHGVARRTRPANPDDPTQPGTTLPPRAARGGVGGTTGPSGIAPSNSLLEARLAAAGITCRGLADLRTRSLIVRGTAKDQQLAADLVAILDTPEGKPLPKVKVLHAFRLENIDGTDLAIMLQTLDPNMTYRLTPVAKMKLLLAAGTDDQMKELADSVKKLDVPADIK